jgi:sugar lactone lactonase YvrE
MSFPLIMMSLLLAPTASEEDAFIQGAPLVGGSNGMFFGADNNLYVAQVLGRAISKINPETGEILEQLGEKEGVFFPDDVTVGPDGTLYWTDTFLGTVYRRPPGGPSEPLYPPGSYPWANPLTLSDDGKRLFFAQCFNFESPNGIYQLDLETNETTTLVDGIAACASNAMDFRDEALYSPRLFEGKVVKIDLANNNAVTDISTGMGSPDAVKFNSKGELFVVDPGSGQVFQIDLENPDLENNREIVATPPFMFIENLAFDKDDRLYISSAARASVLEVLGVTEFRVSSPGILSIPTGVAVLDGVIYTVSALAMYGYNADTGEEVSLVAPMLGMGDLMQPTAVTAWTEGRILQCSFLTDTIVIWNVTDNSALATLSFEAPTDVLPFQDGFLVVESTTGNVVKATGEDWANREVLMNIPGAFFLDGDDKNVYISNTFAGTILQIVASGVVLEKPIVVSSGHAAPEGIALVDDNTILVVAAGSGTLEQVDLETGQISVIGTDLDFLSALPDFGLAFGFSNDVAVYDGSAFVNADGANAIYKFDLGDKTNPPTASPTTTNTSPTISPSTSPSTTPTNEGLALRNGCTWTVAIALLMAVLV